MDDTGANTKEIIMGLLDGILGGAIGVSALQFAGKLINDHGGIAGIAQEFQKQGLGGMVQSWIGGGANQPITPEQVHQMLGADKVAQLAQESGLPAHEVVAHIATTLPQAVDQMTPNGRLPVSAPVSVN